MSRGISLKKIIIFTIFANLFIFLFYIIADLRIIDKTLNSMEKDKIDALVKNNIDTLSSLYYFKFNDELKEIIQNIKKSGENIVFLR